MLSYAHVSLDFNAISISHCRCDLVNIVAMISCTNSCTCSVGVRLTITHNEYHQKLFEVQQLRS